MDNTVFPSAPKAEQLDLIAATQFSLFTSVLAEQQAQYNKNYALYPKVILTKDTIDDQLGSHSNLKNYAQ